MTTRETDADTILLRYGAQRTSKGFLPYYTHNGQYHCVPSTPPVHETREDALSISQQAVKEEIKHYAGDWNIIVEEITL